jgi:DNA mismatch repair protein MutL
MIRKLPASVVNKIAAGEVIERPASVVKELVENSLDAGATRIDVAIEEGGTELVRIVDNGHGIPADELMLAIAPHATSKLVDAADLFRVATLGFRGEALASIAEVSRLRLRSRPADQEAAFEIEVIGGEAGEPSPTAAPQGTLMEVRRLFFNTPVRRKFLKTHATEFGHISEALVRLALPHPKVHFTLSHNGRTVHDLPPTDDVRDRIRVLFGSELADALLPVVSQDDDVRLVGYVAHPSQSRSHARMQYVFLNGRHIRDRALGHALTEAYRGLLTVGRYPIAFLAMEMPADLVDVNVHPTKLEVRFRESGRHYSHLLSTLRTRFLTTNMEHALPTAPATAAYSEPNDAEAEDAKRQLVNWVQAELENRSASAGVMAPPRPMEPSVEFGVEPDWARSESSLSEGEPLRLHTLDRPAAPSPEAIPAAVERGSPAALQVANRYLITGEGDSVVIIDQHALHERVLYEQLRERVLNGKVESQKLLVPEPVDLSQEEATALLSDTETLAKLGLGVEPFGQTTVLVTSYPAMLKNISPAELARDMAAQLMAGGKKPDRRDVIDSLLHMMSCKAAIKAGDRLAPEEISELLRLRHLAQDAHHCPHGRPSALVLTREHLDRQFKRT